MSENQIMISKAELTVISGEIMGYSYVDGINKRAVIDGNNTVFWQPLKDLNQAFQMLEEVCNKNEWECNTLFERGEYSVDIQSDDDSGCGCCVETITHGYTWNHKDPATAIVLACVEAATGVKYELEDEQRRVSHE